MSSLRTPTAMSRPTQFGQRRMIRDNGRVQRQRGGAELQPETVAAP